MNDFAPLDQVIVNGPKGLRLLGRIDHITPTGRIVITNGTTFNPDGSVRGHSFFVSIEPATPQLVEEVAGKKWAYKREGEWNNFIQIYPSEREEWMEKGYEILTTAQMEARKEALEGERIHTETL